MWTCVGFIGAANCTFTRMKVKAAVLGLLLSPATGCKAETNLEDCPEWKACLNKPSTCITLYVFVSAACLKNSDHAT